MGIVQRGHEWMRTDPGHKAAVMDMGLSSAFMVCLTTVCGGGGGG